MAYDIGVRITPTFEGLSWDQIQRFAQNFVDLCLENGVTLHQIRDAINVACSERDPQFLAQADQQKEV